MKYNMCLFNSENGRSITHSADDWKTLLGYIKLAKSILIPAVMLGEEKTVCKILNEKNELICVMSADCTLNFFDEDFMLCKGATEETVKEIISAVSFVQMKDFCQAHEEENSSAEISSNVAGFITYLEGNRKLLEDTQKLLEDARKLSE